MYVIKSNGANMHPCGTPGEKEEVACGFNDSLLYVRVVPMRGTASDVGGIFSATRFRNTVMDNKIVIPVGTGQNSLLWTHHK